MLVSEAVAQPDTATVEKLLHYIMQPLDKSQVPTGILEEWGMPLPRFVSHEPEWLGPRKAVCIGKPIVKPVHVDTNRGKR